jgi:hypothetical protein
MQSEGGAAGALHGAVSPAARRVLADPGQGALSPARYSRTSSTGRRTLTAGSLVAPNRSTICG